MDLRENRDYFTIWPHVIGFYNQDDEERLLRGTS
jgi:hypothetical protein